MRKRRLTDRAFAAGELAGVITIEMVYIIPVILLVFFLSVMGIFYYHDKAVIKACAYEAAVVGSTKAREKEGVAEEMVTAVCKERVQGKCILFGEVQASAQVDEEKVVVQASAVRGKMRLSVTGVASVTEPEQKVRKYRRLTEIVR